jgi:hypothetical protein
MPPELVLESFAGEVASTAGLHSTIQESTLEVVARFGYLTCSLLGGLANARRNWCSLLSGPNDSGPAWQIAGVLLV